MAWLESHQGLANHRKIKRLARKLTLSRPAAIGTMHLLWWWAMDNLPDGCISSVDPEDIADEVYWEGDPQELIAAMVDAEFLDETDRGIFIHNWDQYIGKLLDKRAKDVQRKRKERGESKAWTSEQSPNGTPEEARATTVGEISDVQQNTQGNVKEVQPPSDEHPLENPEIHRTSDGQGEECPRDGAGNSTVPNSTVHNQKNKRKTRQRRTYAEDDSYYRMARYLYDKIKNLAAELNVSHHIPENDMQNWADDFRLLVERDKRTDKDEIRRVIDFATSDGFWRDKILSADKLRDKYQTLLMQMASASRGRTDSQTTGSRNSKRKMALVNQQPTGPVTADKLAEIKALAREIDGKGEKEHGNQ